MRDLPPTLYIKRMLLKKIVEKTFKAEGHSRNFISLLHVTAHQTTHLRSADACLLHKAVIATVNVSTIENKDRSKSFCNAGLLNPEQAAKLGLLFMEKSRRSHITFRNNKKYLAFLLTESQHAAYDCFCCTLLNTFFCAG